MKRDIVYYYDRPADAVYQAFVQAAREIFDKDCKLDPGKSLTFGLNFSFNYNMYGGAVTARFMPYQNGTAINLRYSVAQLFGARYKAHAQDLTAYVNGLLQTQGSVIQLPLQPFLDYDAQTPPAGAASPRAPQPAPTVFCPQCGASIPAHAAFCPGCGAKQG